MSVYPYAIVLSTGQVHSAGVLSMMEDLLRKLLMDRVEGRIVQGPFILDDHGLLVRHHSCHTPNQGDAHMPPVMSIKPTTTNNADSHQDTKHEQLSSDDIRSAIREGVAQAVDGFKEEMTNTITEVFTSAYEELSKKINEMFVKQSEKPKKTDIVNTASSSKPTKRRRTIPLF